MKYFFPIIILLSMSWTTGLEIGFSEKTKLEPCPNSPNCVSTQETRKRKRMRPINFGNTPYDSSIHEAKLKLKALLREKQNNPRITLIKENENYLHYEFKTKVLFRIGYFQVQDPVYD